MGLWTRFAFGVTVVAAVGAAVSFGTAGADIVDFGFFFFGVVVCVCGCLGVFGFVSERECVSA